MRAEFVAKIGVVVEEADEAILWLELMTESGMIPLRRPRHCGRKHSETRRCLVALSLARLS